MEDQLELRIRRFDANSAKRRVRDRERCAMTQVKGCRMSEMADAAVMVLVGLGVPVSGGLQRKRHHQHRHQGGEDSLRDSSLPVQFRTPQKDVS